MLPSVVASQVRASVENYLRATFPMGSRRFAGLIEEFLRSGKMFKGPFYSLGLPFRASERYVFPSGLELAFRPYLHQRKAFDMLVGTQGVGAIVATGTGSGKTECFMYPLLDHCLAHKTEPGVKAIVVYPMNALATDQAKRFAKTIYNDAKLKDNVTVGLFIGGLSDEEGDATMSATGVVTRKATMREYPPDILLTNYKELDYLLVRAKDRGLWAKNKPGTLRYVVVDELHTFDGAQGADLGCLLRRVYSRLGVDPSTIDRVGTSATLGSGESEKARLLEFASEIFGGEFKSENVVEEDALDPVEFIGDARERRRDDMPDYELLDADDPDDYDDATNYLERQARLWLGQVFKLREAGKYGAERIRLGVELKALGFFQDALRALHGKTLDVDELTEALPGAPTLYRGEGAERRKVEFKTTSREFRERVFRSLFALISYARAEADVAAPFLRVRAQLWVREWARMGASLPLTTVNAEGNVEESSPKLAYLADVKNAENDEDEDGAHLPLAHCRACGKTAYLSLKLQKSERLSRNLEKIYASFFTPGSDAIYVYVPTEGERTDVALFNDYLCPKCLTYASVNEDKATCPKCNTAMTPVVFKDADSKNAANKNGGPNWRSCPFCGAQEMAIVGARAASLTSVALSQFLSSRYNDEKKLLAFSDSVQDASHRAGFFVGRSYRSTLRSAIRQYLDEFKTPPTLARLSDGFASYWLKRFESEETANGSPNAAARARVRFIVQFLTPDLQDRYYDSLRERRPAGLNTEEQLKWDKERERAVDFLLPYAKDRARYEIVAEYARLSQIGRTLERAGASVVALEPAVLARWVASVATYLREHLNYREDDALELRTGRFLASFVRELRLSGAVAFDALADMLDGGTSYGVSKRNRFMPKLGTHERAPRFVELGPASSSMLDSLTDRRPGRYSKLLRAALGKRGLDYGADIYRRVVESGYEVGALKKGKRAIYGLSLDALVVATEVDRYRLSETRREFCAARCERGYWEDAKVVDDYQHDDAEYCELQPPRDASATYKRSDICRIVAKEHTGLLARPAREALEAEFIDGYEANAAAVNALSCTPTLEMGVNIGDLSCVALCSIPRDRASFVQRVGRSGRKDGNSFNLAIATNAPRDLYYFNEPSEAFAGPIEPPGIFLNAPTVLERQLAAYTFDRWVVAESERDPDGALKLVPGTLKRLLYELRRKKEDEKPFPLNLYAFTESRRDEIFDDFVAMFPSLSAGAREALREYYYSDSDVGFRFALPRKLKDAEDMLAKYRKDIESASRRARELAKVSGDATIEQALHELYVEKSSLSAAIAAIERKTTYEFLTDEGVLPNYAFPEEGAFLRSALWRVRNERSDDERKTSGEKKYETDTQEYPRPAKMAISELAPGNTFYADGKKLKINRLDLAGKLRVDRWRFCADCGYVHKATDGEPPAKACPKCGALSWSEGERERSVVRIDRVVAELPEKDARAFDESDRRAPERYERRMLIQYGEAQQGSRPGAAFRLPSETAPFAFEYWPKATFQDVNFGRSGCADSIEIAGQAVPSVGFKVCPECGMASDGSQGDEAFKHHVSCKYNRELKQKREAVTEALYLYREFSSEALRLSVPFDTQGTPSFVSVVNMALHEYFHGNVDHLSIELQQDAQSTNARQKFLTIYDEIPGGTGYLKGFAADPTRLFNAFELALKRLKACSCEQDEEKDGCYRCILEFRQGKDASNVSRREAISELETLLKSWRDNGRRVEEIESLGSVDYSRATESVLEADFIAELRKLTTSATTELPTQFVKSLENGHEIYKLTLGERVYAVRQQIDFGDDEGVKVFSRADFLIEPLRAEPGSPAPVVVFTDGYEYHADPTRGNLRLDKDSAQRNAIRQAPKTRYCYSLTYDDVQYASVKDSAHWDLVADPERLTEKKNEKWRLRLSPFQTLIDYLRDPQVEERKALAKDALLAAMKNGDARLRAVNVDDAKAFWNAVANCEAFTELDAAFADLPNAGRKAPYYAFVKNCDARTRLVALIPNDMNADKIHVALVFDDVAALDENEHSEYKRAWNSWLHAFNVLQYLPNAYLTTLSADALPPMREEPTNAYDEAWQEAYNDFPQAREVLDSAFARGLRTIETYSELHDGVKVVGGLNIAWPEEKLFWDEDPAVVKQAQALGWTYYRIEEN